MSDQCDIRMARCSVQNKHLFLDALREIALKFELHIICFNADMVAGERHVRSAVFNAMRSFCEGTPIANTLEMEVLLFAAGSRQCSVASSFGIHDGENRLYICCVPPCDDVWEALVPLLDLNEEEPVMNANKRARVMTLFEITDQELEAAGSDRLTDLVLERVALLNATR
jgi:KEOPS complex subunit Cgi121